MKIEIIDLPTVGVDVHPLHVNPNGPIDAVGPGLILQKASPYNSAIVELVLHDRETGERKKISIALDRVKASDRKINPEPSKVSEEKSETLKKVPAGPAALLSPKASPTPQPAKKVAPAPTSQAAAATPKAPPAVPEKVEPPPATAAVKSPSPSPKLFKGVLKK